MMRKIIDSGTPDQREWAIKTMRITSQMQDERDQISTGSKKIWSPKAAIRASSVLSTMPNKEECCQDWSSGVKAILRLRIQLLMKLTMGLEAPMIFTNSLPAEFH